MRTWMATTLLHLHRRSQHGGGGGGGGEKKERSHLDKVLQEAMKVRNFFIVQTSSARELIKAIDKDQGWQWANNHENKGKLEVALTTAEDAISAELRELILKDSKTLRKEFSEDAMIGLCSQWVAAKLPVLSLQATVTRITRMQKAIGKED